MNSKLTTVVLSVLLVGALAYAIYSGSQLSKMNKEVELWKDKYEEALIDMEEAFKRLEEKDNEVKKALQEAEVHRTRAEEALAELQMQKGKK